MNKYRKTILAFSLIAVGVVAALLVAGISSFFGPAPAAHAQTTSSGDFYGVGISPASVSAGTTITVSGDAQGSVLAVPCDIAQTTWKEDVYGVGGASYNVDGGSPSSTFVLTQTQQGVGDLTCTSNPPSPTPYEYSFSFTINTTGLAAGTHTVNLTARSGASILKYSIQFTITAAVANSTGTVNVTSENAVITSDLVPSSWYFPTYPSTDPCSVAPCQGTTSTYPNMPLGTYGLQPSSTMGSAMGMYAFRSIEVQPVAKQQGNFFLALFSGLSNLLNRARAAVVCGFVDNGTSSCPNNTPFLTLANPGDTANFIILWDPLAAISVSPSTLSLSAANPNSTTSQVTVTNSGSPGSTLDWTASSDKPWLTVWPMSGCLNAGGKAVNGCPDTNGFQYLTLTADSSGLATGTYTGTVTFNWTSLPSGQKDSSPTTLDITFTVGAAPPPPPPANPPSCIFGANPAHIIAPEQSTLSWSCANAVSCQLDGTPVPTSGSEVVSPTTDTTYTLTCQGAGSGAANTVTTQTTVTTGGPNIHEINP